MSTTITVEHLARVEGHGGITVELDDSGIKQVRFDVFEGARLLEGLVAGGDTRTSPDPFPHLPICSVAHSLTSLKATENAFGSSPARQTQCCAICCTGARASRATLCTCSCWPCRTTWVIRAASPWRRQARRGVDGPAAEEAGNTIQEIIGGRAVHPVNVVLGGFGKLPTTDQLIAASDDAARCQPGLPDGDRPHRVFCRPPTSATPTRSSPLSIRARNTATTAATASPSCPTANARVSPLPPTAPSPTRRPSRTRTPSIASTMAVLSMVGSLARLTANLKLIDGRARRGGRALPPGAAVHQPAWTTQVQAVELIFDIERALAAVDELLKDGIRDEVPVPSRRGRARASASRKPAQAC